MSIFIKSNIIKLLKELTSLYAMETKISYKDKSFIIEWTEKSYKLGAIKFCNMFIYKFINMYDIKYLETRLYISNVFSKKLFENQLKDLISALH